MKQAIGLIGGTFDPIHIGHLCPAIETREQLGLQKILFIPNSIPPHRDTPHSCAEHRLKMARLAIRDVEGFEVDDRELKRLKPSYTIDTLQSLRAEYPDTPLCFLMGMDSLLSLASWHRWEELTDYAHLVICHRPGWNPEFGEPIASWLKAHQDQTLGALQTRLCGLVQFVENRTFDISATELRQRIREGKECRYLLPDAVLDYIRQQGLYRPTRPQ
ncbi:nicotinate-nucleotide adenylyltransferase [Dongshaea marina]|uniref:nicotinate-nucleotide adenylyltransferase n=1 Tax=Dongshaea marina TaxID=2047966 RepID=UPI000D3ED4F2|nr:nicotinate-nucleotide adenylyltransferase [Dongshaea marina]